MEMLILVLACILTGTLISRQHTAMRRVMKAQIREDEKRDR